MKQAALPIPVPGKRGSGWAGTGSRWTVFWVSHWFAIALFLPCCCPASLALFCRSLSLASCICVWFHTALMTLNPNCAAAWSLGEKVTGDPFTNPLLSFSLRCKFRIVDADKAKLDYCFLYFPKGREDAGMLCTLPARLREKSPCEPKYAMSWKFIVLFRFVISSAVWDASAVLAVGNINQVGGMTLASVQEAAMWGKFL